MLYYSTKFPREAFSRPSDYVPVEYKLTPEYNLAFQQFIYSQWINGGSIIGYDEQAAIGELRDYAAGRQSSERYKDRYLGRAEEFKRRDPEKWETIFSDREGFTNIDFDNIFSPIPKVLRAIQGVMEDTEHKVLMVATDEKSTSLKQQLKYRALIDNLYKNVNDFINTVYGMENHSQDILPGTIEELDIWEKVGKFKPAYEAAMNDGIDYTEKISELKEVKKDVVQDLLEVGKAVIHTYSNSAGIVKHENIPIEDIIIEASKKRSNQDSSWGGHQVSMTIADIVNEPGLNLTEDELLKLAVSFGTYANNNTLYGPETRTYQTWMDNIRIPVLVSYYKSTDFTYVTELKDGSKVDEPYTKKDVKRDDVTNKVSFRWKKPKVYNNDTRKTKEDSMCSMYTSRWVIGSEVIWGCKRVEDIPYDYENGEVRLPYAYYKLPGKSLVESMIPIEDEIEMTYLELQNARATAMPAGYDIEFSSIMNLSMSDEGKKIHPMDTIKIKKQTGIGFYTLAPPDPRNPQIVAQKPWQPSEGGFNNAVVTAVNALQLYYGDIERLCGLADVSMGKSPSNEQGLGVTQIALATTNSTLRPVYSAYLNMKENATYTGCLKIQSNILNNEGEESPYWDILGPAKYNAIKSSGSYPPVHWGMKTIAKLDQAMIEQILATFQRAMGVGKDGIPLIRGSEYIEILDKLNGNANLPDIVAFLNWKEKTAEMQKFQQSLATQKEQADAAVALADKKKNDELEIIQAKSQAAMMEEELRGRIKEREITLQHVYNLQEQKNIPQKAVA